MSIGKAFQMVDKEFKFKYIRPEIRCSDCDYLLSKAGRVKYPVPKNEINMQCDACENKNPLHRAFRKMNRVISQFERKAVNDYRKYLIEYVKSYSENINKKSFINNLLTKICEIPYCEGYGDDYH